MTITILVLLSNLLLCEALEEQMGKEPAGWRIIAVNNVEAAACIKPDLVLVDSSNLDHCLFSAWPDAKFILLDTGLPLEDMPVEQRLRITEKLTSSGMVPPKGVNIIRWDITPDLWGILVAEAESSADIHQAIHMWRTAGAGFFKSTRTAPAQSIQEAVAQQGELLKTLSAM